MKQFGPQATHQRNTRQWAFQRPCLERVALLSEGFPSLNQGVDHAGLCQRDGVGSQQVGSVFQPCDSHLSFSAGDGLQVEANVTHEAKCHGSRNCAVCKDAPNDVVQRGICLVVGSLAPVLRRHAHFLPGLSAELAMVPCVGETHGEGEARDAAGGTGGGRAHPDGNHGDNLGEVQR